MSALPRFFVSFFVSFSVLAFAASAEAEDGPLEGEMKAFVVTEGEEGEEVLTETGKVEPGQTIEYRLVYENTSEDALQNVSITGPIPENTDYIAGSAASEFLGKPVFSIDDGTSFQPEPVTYTKTLPDGTEKEAVATPDMYTHVRWVVDRFAPSTVRFTYRVKVE